MTNREFFTAVMNGQMTEEVTEHARASLEKLDERNAKRNSKPSKTAIENEPIKEKIIAFITERNEYCIASAIATALELSTNKVSALCRQLVEAGKLTEDTVKVPKQGKRKAYKVA